MTGSMFTKSRYLAWLLMLAVMIGASAAWTVPAHAQQAAKTDAAKTEAEKAAFDWTSSLGGMIVKSGVVAWVFYCVLIVFSVVALTIALERMTKLTQAKMIPPRFVGGLGELVRRGDASADDFTKLCGQAPSPAASILHAGVIRAGRSLPEVEKSMEDALAREMATLRGRNRPLSVIGSVAPLVGLLGTVVGMIFAFHTASEGGPDAEQLAGGIYLALITTAAGLTIAIPCLLLYAWFNARVERYMREIDEQLLETMPSFARLERNDTKPTPSPRRDPVPIAAGASS